MRSTCEAKISDRCIYSDSIEGLRFRQSRPL